MYYIGMLQKKKSTNSILYIPCPLTTPPGTLDVNGIETSAIDMNSIKPGTLDMNSIKTSTLDMNGIKTSAIDMNGINTSTVDMNGIKPAMTILENCQYKSVQINQSIK
jgi:hypothetical protein